MPSLGKLVGQINGVAASAFTNCVNCASEYDSIGGKSAGDRGTIDVVVDVVVSWACNTRMPTAKMKAANANKFRGVFIVVLFD